MPEISGFETDFSLAGFGSQTEFEAFAQSLQVNAGIAFGAEKEGFNKKTGSQKGKV